MERDYIRESMKFGDIGDSSYSDQELNEGKSISVRVEMTNSLLGRFEWGCCMHCYHIKFRSFLRYQLSSHRFLTNKRSSI